LTQVQIRLLFSFHFRRGAIGKPTMMNFRISDGARLVVIAMILFPCVLGKSSGQQQPQAGARAECRVEPVDYKGWHAQQISNPWMRLILVPQNGGRLMQVTFAGHDYLFVNPKLAGEYFPPNPTKWFNYGGDKIWLLPEGNNDEQHWAGNSDLLDDGSYEFQKLSEGKQCKVELTSQADRQTGIQISRTIQLNSDSSCIRFNASMKNITGHTVEWSMQSVSQYDTTDLSSSSRFNHNFWTFTPVSPSSAYLNSYHVRYGQAENPAVSVRDDGFFTVHYVHMAAELWLDSTAGWVAVVDGNSRYAMVERFEYQENKSYPGKASVIFWTNGSEMRLGADGIPTLTADSDAGPYYLEAELNSPLCRLHPGESCTFETQWFPTRAEREFHGVTEAAVIVHPLESVATANGKVKISGSFGVLFSGHLIARFYDGHGSLLGTLPVANVSPTELVSLDTEISPPGQPARVSLHLEDEGGMDRGSLQEVRIAGGGNH
jgi:hypothetical protein